MKELIVYKERYMLDRYSCIDFERKIILYNTWQDGGIIYGYKNKFDIRTVSTDMIISRTIID